MNKAINELCTLMHNNDNRFQKETDRKERPILQIAPINWGNFVTAYENNGYVSKYPEIKARDIVTENLYKQINLVIQKFNLKLIDEKYDDYNWYCIFGNYHSKVKETININDWIESNTWKYDIGTRGIGTAYYSIFVNDEMIIGKCETKERLDRWILIADQTVFDNVGIEIC